MHIRRILLFDPSRWLSTENVAACLGTIVGLAFIGCLIDFHVVGSGGGEMPVRHGAEFLFRMGYCCRKFLLNSPVLAVMSSVIGCSRAILTKIMCGAMNRGIFNVVSGGKNVAAPVKKSGEEVPKVHVETSVVHGKPKRTVFC